MARAVLLGMNNPLGRDPRHALFPAPVGCTGYRIWQMLHAHTGALRQEYADGFDRLNIVDNLAWDRQEARYRAVTLMRAQLSGRHVVCLGAEVRDAMGFPEDWPPVRRWGHDTRDRFAGWRWIPHPSGRNPFYNDPEARIVVGLLLEELYERGKQS